MLVYSRWQKWCGSGSIVAMTLLEKFLKWTAIIGVFALPFVPIIVSSSLFFPYITGKNFAFRIVTEVIFAAWLALALVVPKYRPRKSVVLGALALFVFIIGLADAVGVHPFKSFWSNYERMDGWVTLAHLLAYTVVASAVMTSERLWRNLFKTSLGVSILLAINGFMQIAGVTALGGGGTGNLMARIDATFGNPIYLAIYMLFHVFLAAMLWSQMWNMRRPGERLWPSVGYAAIMAVDTITLFFTSTRGTILGLAGGILLTAFLMLVLARNSRNAWRLSVGAVAVVLTLVAGVWVTRGSEFVHKIGFVERLATISTTDSTVKARFLNWGMAWEGVKERPILGWGQENYAIVFDKHYDPRMYGQEQWFDRVHNIVFDWLVAGGFLGLISYFGVFAAALWVLWKSGGFSIAERSILTGLFAGYTVHNFFVFDNVVSYILFGTVLAFIAWRAAEAARTPVIPAAQPLRSSALPWTATAGVALAIVLVWSVNVPAYAANRTLLSAIAPNPGGPTANLEAFKKAIAYGALGTQEAREQLVQLTTQMAGNQGLPEDLKRQFLQLAAEEMKKQAAESPLDARFPLFLGVLLDAHGAYGEAQPALELAHKLSPGKQTILFEVGQNAILRGDTAGALAAYKQAYELEPSFRTARLMYVVALVRAGQDSEADTVIASMIEDGAAADSQLALAYVSRGQFGKLQQVWKAHLAKNPNDVQAYVTLAAAYYVAGDRISAVAAIGAAKKVADPSMVPQLDGFIQQIRSGTAKVM